MLETKLFEIRDEGTFIAAVAMRVSEADGPLACRAGYGPNPCILLGRLDGTGRLFYDPYEWPTGSRTMKWAHEYVIDNWDDLVSGDVIDVEFVRGLTAIKKVSEL